MGCQFFTFVAWREVWHALCLAIALGRAFTGVESWYQHGSLDFIEVQ